MEQNFNYSNLPVRILTDENEENWFACVDICNILEYQNVADIIDKKLDDDEKKLDYLTDRSGQSRKTWTINEPGLYSLILSSTKPEAKAFKRWITHQVLPQIRKAGKYNSEQEKEHDLSLQSVAGEIQQLKEQRDQHQKATIDLKREIEQKIDKMIALIKRDKSQLSLQFPE